MQHTQTRPTACVPVLHRQQVRRCGGRSPAEGLSGKRRGPVQAYVHVAPAGVCNPWTHSCGLPSGHGRLARVCTERHSYCVHLGRIETGTCCWWLCNRRVGVDHEYVACRARRRAIWGCEGLAHVSQARWRRMCVGRPVVEWRRLESFRLLLRSGAGLLQMGWICTCVWHSTCRQLHRWMLCRRLGWRSSVWYRHLRSQAQSECSVRTCRRRFGWSVWSVGPDVGGQSVCWQYCHRPGGVRSLCGSWCPVAGTSLLTQGYLATPSRDQLFECFVNWAVRELVCLVWMSCAIVGRLGGVVAHDMFVGVFSEDLQCSVLACKRQRSLFFVRSEGRSVVRHKLCSQQSVHCACSSPQWSFVCVWETKLLVQVLCHVLVYPSVNRKWTKLFGVRHCRMISNITVFHTDFAHIQWVLRGCQSTPLLVI